jgi:hypothetical protein
MNKGRVVRAFVSLLRKQRKGGYSKGKGAKDMSGMVYKGGDGEGRWGGGEKKEGCCSRVVCRRFWKAEGRS